MEAEFALAALTFAADDLTPEHNAGEHDPGGRHDTTALAASGMG